MLASPRRPSSTTRIFSSAEKCRRVARRMSWTIRSAGALTGSGFCLIFAPDGYDDPEILPFRIPSICPTGADGGQHQTLKNRILLENYYLPGDLERQVATFVEHYNHGRYHESLDNLTPADVYFGRGETILLERQRIKRQTISNRRLQHHAQAA